MAISFTLQCDTAEELRAALDVLAPAQTRRVEWKFAGYAETPAEQPQAEPQPDTAPTEEAPTPVEDPPLPPAEPEAPAAKRTRTRKPKEQPAEPESDLLSDPAPEETESAPAESADTPAPEKTEAAAEEPSRTITLQDCRRAMIGLTSKAKMAPGEISAYMSQHFGSATLTTMDPSFYAAAYAQLLAWTEQADA